ncbi:hypothetical protein N7501_006276 [Penicillium viridicatum]|nr:hypothetical protein N7501_006276 [Penicillium viridicatum]
MRRVVWKDGFVCSVSPFLDSSRQPRHEMQPSNTLLTFLRLLEDSSMMVLLVTVNYIRLRFVARKPE